MSLPRIMSHSVTKIRWAKSQVKCYLPVNRLIFSWVNESTSVLHSHLIAPYDDEFLPHFGQSFGFTRKVTLTSPLDSKSSKQSFSAKLYFNRQLVDGIIFCLSRHSPVYLIVLVNRWAFQWTIRQRFVNDTIFGLSRHLFLDTFNCLRFFIGLFYLAFVEECHSNSLRYYGHLCTSIADRYLCNLTHEFFGIRAFYPDSAQILPPYHILCIIFVPGATDEDAPDN